MYDLYAFGLETHRYERYYVETILGSSADNYPLWHERSPLNFVERIRAPLLLLHGEQDPAALPAQSETLIRELERRRIDYERAYYSGEGHGFRKVATNIDYATADGPLPPSEGVAGAEPGAAWDVAVSADAVDLKARRYTSSTANLGDFDNITSSLAVDYS